MALSTELTTLLSTISTDSLAVAAAVLVVLVGIQAFQYIRGAIDDREYELRESGFYDQ